MKRKAAVIALVFGLSFGMNAAHAAHSLTHHTNAATRATSNGVGQAATPAIPGNITADAKVTTNRQNEMDNREHAADLRAAAEAKGESGEINSVSDSAIERPTIQRPEVQRPEIQRPEINR